MAKLDPHVLSHLEWIGYAQPTGLVVSAPALVRAGAILNRRDSEGQSLLQKCTQPRHFDAAKEAVPWLPDFRNFAATVLGWSFRPAAYAGTAENPIPADLEIVLPETGATLRPDFAVRELEPRENGSAWQVLVQVLEPGQPFDKVARDKYRLELSPQGAMERLLRHTTVPAGILFNGWCLRLVSAPRGESSGWIDFRVEDMCQSGGRSLVSALRLLLSENRLLALPRGQRLAALLEDSRKYQNEVSERLAEQVLHALYELLRGFQAAQDTQGHLLQDILRENPGDVYRGLLTVLLRMVFLLYAEEREMLPGDEVFARYYSLAGLHARLREDAALNPDSLDQRYGAWAQLLALFRIVHDGARIGKARLPARHGVLFDPDRYPFLEGRPYGSTRQVLERIDVPKVPDGTLHRALENLLVLDGERISYRALDVEQIGSVYETMMGFRLEAATGPSVSIKAAKKQGAPITISLMDLLEVAPAKREAWLEEACDRKFGDKVKKAVMAAATVEDAHAALLPVIDSAASPDLIPPEAMVLQPSEERRRSGSHYTPRALTEPIVRTTLEPVLARLRGAEGKPPRPEAILDLKVCDPAMGSGAFLVEACRQLGDALMAAWRAWDIVPVLPPDEDLVVYARRLVAQRCLYGVDKNPMAVDLAKVSLWLVTLAREHALTFVDHALRHGDSLVGLSRKQIEAFHWDGDKPAFKLGLETIRMQEHLAAVTELRRQIREAGEQVSDAELRRLWNDADAELEQVRLCGDLVVAAFFAGGKPKERESRRKGYADELVSGPVSSAKAKVEALRYADPALVPFHWQIEFPEVFERDRSGFDSFVGNPPFMGGSKISNSLTEIYAGFLHTNYQESKGKSDLVAYFFRRAFDLMRPLSTLGFISTNTIREGDTRFTGMRWIRNHNGKIYSANRRYIWPGSAAVVVSIVNICKGDIEVVAKLDGKNVGVITAYLLPFGPDEDPFRLNQNKSIAFSGINPNGKGFVLSKSKFEELVNTDPTCSSVLFPYLGSVEMNETSNASATRFIIALNSESESDVMSFPSVYNHLFNTVRMQRASNKEIRLREKWWLFSRPAKELSIGLERYSRVIVSGRVSTYLTFTFQPASIIFSDAVTVFLFDSDAAFSVLQSQIHEAWVKFQGSSFKDDPRYIPEDCFETFPFPPNWKTNSSLNDSGTVYYESRSGLMSRLDVGLTETYNRFHNPEVNDLETQKLRDLHSAMDRAVLDAYGWTDIPTDCDFFLDYEIDDDEWGDKKKPYRYRWPDFVRDEVLARLLELNAQRAQEEALTGAREAAAAPPKKTQAKKAPATPGQADLFSQNA